MILPAGIVQGLFPQGQMQTAAEPFTWGAGGRRMLPEDIARQREIGLSRMQADFSPVQHWTQGLGRVAENLFGAMDVRDAEKASAANRDYSDVVLKQLMNPSGTLSASAPPGAASSTMPGGNVAALSQIIADPYVSPQVQAMAKRQLDMIDFENKQRLQAQYAEPTPQERLAKAAFPNDPARQMQYLRNVAQNEEDPFVNVIGNPDFGTYAGRQSGLNAILGGRQQGAVPAPGTVVADPRKQGGQSATPAGTF